MAKVEVAVVEVTVRTPVESAVVVAPVAVKFVLVALVKVAFVPKRLVKVPRVAVKMDAKRLVLVACVEVLRRIFAKIFCPLKVFASARSVDDAPLVLRQVPAIAKHPDARLIPLTALVVPVPPSSVVVPIAKPNSADGVVEPIPMALLALIRKTDVVAEPLVLVDEAMSKSACSEPPRP